MSWFEILKYYQSARAEDVPKNYNLPMKIEQNANGEFINLPTYQEFEAEGKRLQQEAREASANGHSAIAQSLINLMKYNHERMFNFYYNGPDTYKKREDMMRRFR